jgi:alkane 1-monooxygenase
MSNLRPLKYLLAYSLPVLAYLAFHSHGWITFAPMIEAFLLIPLFEVFLRPSKGNLSQIEEEMIREDPVYDWMIYVIVPITFYLGFDFLTAIQEVGLTTTEKLGRITSMGMICGTLGINVGHELGHRKKPFERGLAKLLLLSSFYMHFYIEHNRGHHKKVSTPEDPASAQYGQTVFGFWVKSIVYSYLSAWKLEFARMQKLGKPKFSLNNQMLVFQVIQFSVALSIGLYFGWLVMGYYILAALMGILLLETVNYIEHYGLTRNQVSEGRYERVMPHHSWNSNHPMGRLMLFELSRHSDHHFLASRKYQVLKNYEEAPSMPTGYPGMMVLALFPPLWFQVMHSHMKKLELA